MLYCIIISKSSKPLDRSAEQKKSVSRLPVAARRSRRPLSIIMNSKYTCPQSLSLSIYIYIYLYIYLFNNDYNNT